MMSLFEEDESERKEEPIITLEELEERKEALFHELAEVAEEQRALVSKVRVLEKDQNALQTEPGEAVAEAPLSHEDLARWVETVKVQFARTMPQNPHEYVHRRWCDSGMFSRVVEYIREHGYSQRYGSSDYICYDIGNHFYWTMGSPVEETIILNRKPISMKPEKEDG